MPSIEHHYVHRTAWLRAAVLGANDGLVSMGSLLVGMGVAGAPTGSILLTGAAGLMAGTLSMAAGEYVSVASQLDLERGDLETERRALVAHPKEELAELTDIYVERGLEPGLAKEVARQLTAHDALGAHARDELQIVPDATRPLMAAASSGLSFASGGAVPFVAALLAGPWGVGAAVLVGLAALGLVSARAGGADPARAVGRIVIWGTFAMVVTGGVGWLVGGQV